MLSKNFFCASLAVVTLGLFCATAGATPAPPPSTSVAGSPEPTGRYWSNDKIGGQNDGTWTLPISTTKGSFIDTWSVGVAPITFYVGGSSRSGNVMVSLAGRSNNGTWLPTLNATQTPSYTSTGTQKDGYSALWGRSGGWVTNFLGAGGDFDDIWTLNSNNLNLPKNAKVTGYKLRTFAYVDDASFEFDESFAS